MNYTMTTPCDTCPFTMKTFSMKSLREHASGEFACHKTCDLDEEESVFTPRKDSVHCAGALIFLEKRNQPHQMMRISERLGMYDPAKAEHASERQVKNRKRGRVEYLWCSKAVI